MSTTVALLLALFLLLANGFFVAVEFGLIATQRAQLEDPLAELLSLRVVHLPH